MLTVRRLLEALSRRLPAPRVIFDRLGTSPYLSRWYLLGAPREMVFTERGNPVGDAWARRPVDVYLHKFHRGDDDQALHSHPWRWSVAIILAGGYIEERRMTVPAGLRAGRSPAEQRRDCWVGKRVHFPGSINIILGDDYHRVDLLEEDSWSLFIAGPRESSWNFWDRFTGETIPWREFISRIRGGEGRAES